MDNIREAAAVLKNTPAINYIGYLEGNDLLTGKTDVMVCDGFVGNVTLKTMEGVIRMFYHCSNHRAKAANSLGGLSSSGAGCKTCGKAVRSFESRPV